MDQSLPIVLDPTNLPAFLIEHGWRKDGGNLTVSPLSGGVSNQAFWVEGPDGPAVVKQARPRLAVAMEWLADVGRIVREAEAMDWLHQRLGSPRIPRMLHLDKEAKVLMMEAVEAPAENYKTRLLRGEVNPEHAAAFGGLLADLHNHTADAATRERFGDATFFDQLRLSPYYDTVAERHPGLAPRIAELRRECRQDCFCLVHGDYSPKNVLVRGETLILLDYEVAHWGNPSFDLGFALTHFLCKALHLPAHGPAFIRAARRFWEAYQSGITLPEASRAQAGSHLAVIMLARMDGKSPLEYFTNEYKRRIVRNLASLGLSRPDTTIDEVIGGTESAMEVLRT